MYSFRYLINLRTDRQGCVAPAGSGHVEAAGDQVPNERSDLAVRKSLAVIGELEEPGEHVVGRAAVGELRGASFDLLVDSDLSIIAEVIIPIAHYLIGAPGAKFEDVSIVESHPVALAQCELFFHAHPKLRRIATEDTAGSVRSVTAAGDRGRAAIASRRAARTYDGVILREHLEDNRENYTRFLLLSPSNGSPENANKLSLVFELDHKPGALLHACKAQTSASQGCCNVEAAT